MLTPAGPTGLRKSIRNSLEQLRHKSDAMEVGEVVCSGAVEHDGEWGRPMQPYTLRRGEGQRKRKRQDRFKGILQESQQARRQEPCRNERLEQDDSDYPVYKRRTFGKQGHKAAQCGKETGRVKAIRAISASTTARRRTPDTTSKLRR